MKWIKYQVVQDTIDGEVILLTKKIEHSEANLAIANTEAYDGYEIIEDEKSFEEKPLSIELGGTGGKTAEEARKNLNVDFAENLLINSYFKNPVNQSGKSLYAGKGYSVDKWYCSSDNWNVSVEDGYIRFYSDNLESTGMLTQYVPITSRVRGQKVTLVAKVKGDYVRLNLNGETGSYNRNDSDWVILVKTATAPTDGDSFPVSIQNNKLENTSGFLCEWAALYVGEYTVKTAPKFIPKDFEVERLNCNGGCSNSFKATLPADGWSSEAPFTQTIEVDGIFATDEPFIDVNMSGIVSSGTSSLTLEAYSLIGRAVVRDNNSLQVYCYEEKPSIDIPIMLKVVR